MSSSPTSPSSPSSPEVLREAPSFARASAVFLGPSAVSTPTYASFNLGDFKNDDGEPVLLDAADCCNQSVASVADLSSSLAAPEMSSCASPDAAFIEASEFRSGEPGHTPFPHRSRPRVISNTTSFLPSFSTAASYFVAPSSSFSAAAITSSDSHSFLLPPPPFNSPNESSLMLEAAKRQEMSLKRAIERGEFNAAEEDEDGKDAFRTPERAAGAVPKQRKRLRDQMNSPPSAIAVDLSLSMTPAAVYLADKNADSRDRHKSAMALFVKLVPGLEETEGDTRVDIFEQTARYLKFLKEKVGSKYDREFLSQAMPY